MQKMLKLRGWMGLVCSPLESGRIHAVCGNGFLTVTPGVRFADGAVGDQKRVATPADAKALGSVTLLWVGRLQPQRIRLLHMNAA